MVTEGMLGSQVDKPFKILLKTSNASKYFESNIQNIEATRISSNMYKKTYLKGSLEGVLEAIQVSSLYCHPYSLPLVGSSLESSSPRDKKNKGDNAHKAFMGTLSCGHLPQFIDIWSMNFS